MNRFASIASALALFCAAAPVNAADLPIGSLKDSAVTSNTWTGFYLGANLGYAWQGQRDAIAGAGFWSEEPTAFTATADHPNLNGVVGGGQLGYNIQRGSLVFGIVTDFQGAGISAGTDTKADVYHGGTEPVAGLSKLPLTASQSIDWYGTVRGKLGLAVDHWLFYGTGGYAYGNVRDKLSATYADTNYSLSNNSVRSGYAAGAGVEYLMGNWSLGAEYLYVDLGPAAIGGDVIVSQGNTVHVHTNDINSDMHTVRLLLNYHLN